MSSILFDNVEVSDLFSFKPKPAVTTDASAFKFILFDKIEVSDLFNLRLILFDKLAVSALFSLSSILFDNVEVSDLFSLRLILFDNEVVSNLFDNAANPIETVEASAFKFILLDNEVVSTLLSFKLILFDNVAVSDLLSLVSKAVLVNVEIGLSKSAVLFTLSKTKATFKSEILATPVPPDFTGNTPETFAASTPLL